MENNILSNFVETVLPYIISMLEIMGIIIVTWSGIKAFVQYIQNSFFKKHYKTYSPNCQPNFDVG